MDSKAILRTGETLLVVVGPTAVGKTAVAVELAMQIDGEIINADSMQVYRYMDIGTAKPTAFQRNAVPFHLIDIAEPGAQLTVADWKALAEEAITEIRGRGNLPIVCGGTGLYIKALLDNWKLAETPADSEARAILSARAAVAGSHALHEELATVDPETAARLHPNDALRIIRALEVYYATGTRISDLQAQDRLNSKRRAAIQFGLALPRPELYERIELRVDDMLRAGLEDEVRGLIGRGIGTDLGPMRSLGYKEMVQYVTGQRTYSETVVAIKQSTRQYAKRQQTWFKADTSIHWIDVSALNSATVTSQILHRLESAA